jgi:hypothetical protein
MEEAHARLDIKDAQWRAMMADPRKTVDKVKAPTKEQQELVAIVESTKGDIVLGSHRGAPPGLAGFVRKAEG